MAKTIDPDHYKLNTEFYDGYVVHTVQGGGGSINTTWKEERKIGGGGFGSIGLEKAVVGGQEVVRVVKRISQDVYTNKGIDFKREVRALIAVQDRKDLFVQFLGWYEDTRHFFLAMEYVKDGDLGYYIKEHRGKAGYTLDVISIAKQLLEALSFIHEKKICHRDIKPQNVLMASLSPVQVKLADFGASKSTAGSELKTQYVSPGYSAPEMYGLLPRNLHQGRKYPSALDMWAFGCLVHEALTGEVPFSRRESDSVHHNPTGGIVRGMSSSMPDMALMSRVCWGEVPLPTDILEMSQVDGKAIDFIKRLLKVNPILRISAAEALKHEWLTGLKLPASPGQVDISMTDSQPASSAPSPWVPPPQRVPLSPRAPLSPRVPLSAPFNPRTIGNPSPSFRQRDSMDRTRSISSTPEEEEEEEEEDLPELLFRTFYTGGPRRNPFCDFDASILDDPGDHISELQMYFRNSTNFSSNAPILATSDLLYAIHLARGFELQRKKGISIAIINLETCPGYSTGSCEGLYQASDPSEFRLSAHLLETTIIECLSLKSLIKSGLYRIVPELRSDHEMEIQDLRKAVKDSQWRWGVEDRLVEIGYKAAQVALCFGSGIHTKVIAIEVAEWWASWWENGVIDKAICDVLDS